MKHSYFTNSISDQSNLSTLLLIVGTLIRLLHSKKDIENHPIASTNLQVLYVLVCSEDRVSLNSGVARELVSRGHDVDILMTSSKCVDTLQGLVPGVNEVRSEDLLDSNLSRYPFDTLSSLLKVSRSTENITLGVFGFVRDRLKRKKHDVVVADELLVGAAVAAKVRHF